MKRTFHNTGQTFVKRGHSSSSAAAFYIYFFLTKRNLNMSKAHPPELKKYMDKRMMLKLNGGRAVTGILRGFDPFMNVVLDDTVEECKDNTKNSIGMVVIRGNSIVMVEALDRV